MGKKQERSSISATASFIPGFIVTLPIFLQLFRFARSVHFAVESFEGNFSVKKAGPDKRRFLRQKT
jgi:hypothetical protein